MKCGHGECGLRATGPQRPAGAAGPHLLLHARLQEQHDAGLEGQRDLAPAPLQVFFQRRPEGRLLCPLI